MGKDKRTSEQKQHDKLIRLSDYCCEWSGAHIDRKSSPLTVKESYPEMMTHVLKVAFLMPRKSAERFIGTDSFSGACSGNWERLHLMSMEEDIPSEKWAESLLYEVWYFSDRWSWDRVLRAQWKWKQLCNRLRKEESMERQ